MIAAPPPTYNVAPTHLVTVVYETGSDRAESTGTAPEATIRRFGRFRWGLVPSWAKDPAIGNKLINARGETISKKPSFRSAFQNRRCLILADGFFEWRVIEGRRRPLYIRLRSQEPFAMAGLWEEWRAPKSALAAVGGGRRQSPKAETQDLFGGGAEEFARDDEPSGHDLITASAPLRSCTIVTTEANELMARFHHRMPVILPPDAWDEWLSAITTTERLHALIAPYPAELMEYHDVATIVNSPRHNAPACLKPTGPVRTLDDPPEDLP